MTSLKAAEVTAFHDRCHDSAGWVKSGAQKFPAGPWNAIEDNHRCNCLLWDEEDLARRRNVPDSEIANNKRAIDGYNQKRNDAIERIDEELLPLFRDIKKSEQAKLSSETPGAIIDRLSILSLKVHHMRLQTLRTDVARTHIEDCLAKLNRLNEQRTDLASCLDQLLTEAERGETWFKVYRQFKMYNDPALNPAVYNESKRPTRS